MDRASPAISNHASRSAPLSIVRHGPQHADAVEAFNPRMRAGGSSWGFYTKSECHWLPEREGRRVWREYFLAVEPDGVVRGGYALKPQPWWIQGKLMTAADWQGPFSEGAVNPRYGTVSLRILRE